MSDTKSEVKQQQPAPKPAPTGDSRSPIAVRTMRFREPVDFKGPSGGTETVTAIDNPREGQAHYRLEFRPWMRHHAITFTSHLGETSTRMVHESHVESWEAI